jgi:AcrR family transcriptional regulator
MFKIQKTKKQRQGATETKEQILRTALEMFRGRGMESATVREIAKAAGVALGAAYYYFPSKEAIVLAYYDGVQAEHLALARTRLAEGKQDLLERMKIVFHAKLEILRSDRKLLGTLFRYTGEPGHPLSVLGAGTRKNREESMAVFALALEGEDFPEDVRTILPPALWALHLGILLYFIYDESADQERTWKLCDGLLQLVARALPLVNFPLLKPVRGSLLAVLRDAGLFTETAATISQQEVQ